MVCMLGSLSCWGEEVHKALAIILFLYSTQTGIHICSDFHNENETDLEQYPCSGLFVVDTHKYVYIRAAVVESNGKQSTLCSGG